MAGRGGPGPPPLRCRRGPVDRPTLVATTAALRHLAATGYPCPTPIDGPRARDWRVVTVQSLLTRGETGDARKPELRRAMTASLAEHIAVLHGFPGGAERLAARLGAGPAWTRYRDGPWPEPHDTIFDFAVTPAGWEWLDDYARDGAAGAAARWVLAFNARCDLSMLDGEPAAGSALDRLSRDREGYRTGS